MYKHSFAKVWLDYLGNEIYINNKRILKPASQEIAFFKQYLNQPEFVITHGQSLLEQEEIKSENEIISLDRLNKLGFTVLVEKVGERRWESGQQVLYYIGRKKINSKETTRSALRDYNIYYDRFNKRVKLEGKYAYNKESRIRGSTGWISLKREFQEPIPEYHSFEEIVEMQNKVWLGQSIKQTTIKEIKVRNEVPIIITEEEQLICLPYEDDMQSIGITGQKGKGKSFTTHTLLDGIHNFFHDNIIFINDSLNQFHSMMSPNNVKTFKTRLARIGLIPRPLPTVNLYLSCPNVEFAHQEEGISFRLVVSFIDFLKRYTYFTRGIKRLNLDGKESYLNEFLYDFEKITSADEIVDLMRMRLPKSKKEDDPYGKMIAKWKPKFDNILNSMFTDNMFQDDDLVSAKWKATIKGEEVIGNPILILAECGIIPIVNTSFAKKFSFFRNTMGHFQSSIIDWQIYRGNLKQRLWVFADEIQDIYEIGKRNDNAKDSLEENFRQGRINSVGYVYNSQSFSKLHEDIKKNTTHLLVTYTQDATERKQIGKNYLMNSDEIDEMAKLKSFEFLAISNDNWVVYDKFGKRTVTSGIFKGKCLPPMSLHLSPANNVQRRVIEQEKMEE